MKNTAKILLLAMDEYGSPFEFRNANRPEEINYLRWSPFEEGTDYFSPSEIEFMINYRVQNIEGLVKKLRGAGVNILDDIRSLITENLFISWTLKGAKLNYGNQMMTFSPRWEEKRQSNTRDLECLL
jgi:hypothetical protein